MEQDLQDYTFSDDELPPVPDTLAPEDEDDWLARMSELAGDEPAVGGGRVPAALPRERRLKLVTRSGLKDLPAPSWIVEGVVPDYGYGVLYGPSNIGKSFIAIDWACSVVAKRKHWFGHKMTKHGSVLYVMGEGVRGSDRRVSAWEQQWGVAVSDELVMNEGAVNMQDPTFVDEIAEAVAAMDSPPVMIVLDTLAVNMEGDENSTADMGAVVRNANRLSQLTNAFVLFVHHTGKVGDDLRGNGSLYNGAAAVWHVGAEGGEFQTSNGKAQKLLLTTRKQRDGAKQEPRTVYRMSAHSACVVLDVVPGHTVYDSSSGGGFGGGGFGGGGNAALAKVRGLL